ncbi:hypothetical protein B0H19DRAFT_1259283 [Mycena capillaripes]|nr:hypothetical protein B0H19DRAFT_1259283 [Mycena capillaripes]
MYLPSTPDQCRSSPSHIINSELNRSSLGLNIPRCWKPEDLSGEPPSRPPSNALPTPPILPVALPVTGLPGPVPETGT